MMHDIARVKKQVAASRWGEDIWVDEPLSAHTSYLIGGPADVFAVAAETERMVELLGRAREEGIPAMVLGEGSNILVADAGFRGMVVKNACRGVDGSLS